jgi:hypothetical protein
VFPFNTRRTAIFSLDKIKQDLHYHSAPFQEWMPKTLDWFTKVFRGHSNGYDRRHEELAFIESWKRGHEKQTLEIVNK